LKWIKLIDILFSFSSVLKQSNLLI
jgi:hypothetical protein